MEKVSVFLADWQVLFREGIHFTLSGEEDIDVIGEATDNEEALNSIEANPPRVAVLNADRGKPSGIDVTRRIKQNLPSVSVVLVLDSDNEEQLFSAIKCGASVCLTKDIDPDELVSIIRKVAQGAYLISEALLKPGIASRIIDEFEAFALISKEAGDLLARLTPHEGEILRHVAEGNSIEQLTQTLSINEEAIKRHLEHILTKLAANDHNREVIEAGELSLFVHHPVSLEDSTNNNSVVLHLAFGEIDFLFTGDAEQEAEGQMMMLSSVKIPEVEVLKVGHHGSYTSSSPDFLSITSPEVAIYMAKEGNSYGHPHQETIDGLNAIGAKIYGMDINGNIVITTDGKQYSVAKER